MPGNVSSVACQDLVFGPGPADSFASSVAHRTIRVDCAPLPWNCTGSQPRRNSPCVSPGIWFIPGSVTPTPTSPIVITGNTTIQGNLTVPVDATITIRIGAIVTVSGCVTVSGNLVVDATGREIANGTEIDVINFNSTCGVVGFKNISVDGAATENCKAFSGAERITTRGLSVIFAIVDDPKCAQAPSDGASSSNMTAIIAGSVSGGVFLVIVILFIVLFVFRRRIIPSYRMESMMRRTRTTQEL